MTLSALEDSRRSEPGGQTCITAGRHIVQRGIAEGYTRGLAARADAITLGNTVTENVGLGPTINSAQLERAAAMLAEAVSDGRGSWPAVRRTARTSGLWLSAT